MDARRGALLADCAADHPARGRGSRAGQAVHERVAVHPVRGREPVLHDRAEHRRRFQSRSQAMVDGYGRAASLPSAGFAAGPCLLKDTMQLAAFNANGFSLGHAAMGINEGLPSFLVESLKQRHKLDEIARRHPRHGVQGRHRRHPRLAVVQARQGAALPRRRRVCIPTSSRTTRRSSPKSSSSSAATSSSSACPHTRRTATLGVVPCAYVRNVEVDLDGERCSGAAWVMESLGTA